ncbi:MAG TPA: energy transducer TonB [Pyrinomonadaceae bacterium]|nr:energy transducer TonB [Pyrinomonadaceae bacterium]
MRKLALTFLAGFLLLLPTSSGAQSPEIPVALRDEYGIRLNAIDAPQPAYPEEAKKAGAHGLVIAAVHFDVRGDCVGVEVLASPHPAITESVTSAIRRWRLKPLVMNWGAPARVQGELRWRYVIDDGVYRVELLPKAEQKRHSQQYKRMEKSFRRSWESQEIKN